MLRILPIISKYINGDSVFYLSYRLSVAPAARLQSRLPLPFRSTATRPKLPSGQPRRKVFRRDDESSRAAKTQSLPSVNNPLTSASRASVSGKFNFNSREDILKRSLHKPIHNIKSEQIIISRAARKGLRVGGKGYLRFSYSCQNASSKGNSMASFARPAARLLAMMSRMFSTGNPLEVSIRCFAPS